MAMNTPLRIALFEESPRLFTLLSASLNLAGHSVSRCSKEGYPLATFLQELVEELKHPYIPYYDLAIIDVSETLLSDEIVTSLEQLVREQSLPMILQAEADNKALDFLKAKAAMVPVLFQTVLHLQEHVFSYLSGTTLRF